MTGERDGLSLDNSDLETELAGRGGDLRPDEAGADHDEAFSGGQVSRRAIASSRERSTCTPSSSSPPAGVGRDLGGENDPIGRDLAAVAQQYRAADVVQADRRRAQPPLDVEVSVVRCAQGDVVQRGSARQELLGQGRAVIGRAPSSPMTTMRPS